MALKETEKDINASPSLKQPTMAQLGGLEYNLKKQQNGSRWQREKFEKGNERQQYKNSQPAREDHMVPEGRLYSSKSTNGGKGLKNSKINSYFTP